MGSPFAMKRGRNALHGMSLSLNDSHPQQEVPAASTLKERAQKLGLLKKLSGKGILTAGTWRPRHCLLVKSRLYFFENEDSTGTEKSSGFINLEYFDSVSEASTRISRKASHVFVIGASDKGFFESHSGRHYFAAESLTDMKEWISAINSSMNKIRPKEKRTSSHLRDKSPSITAFSKTKDKEREREKEKEKEISGSKMKGGESESSILELGSTPTGTLPRTTGRLDSSVAKNRARGPVGRRLPRKPTGSSSQHHHVHHHQQHNNSPGGGPRKKTVTAVVEKTQNVRSDDDDPDQSNSNSNSNTSTDDNDADPDPAREEKRSNEDGVSDESPTVTTTTTTTSARGRATSLSALEKSSGDHESTGGENGPNQNQNSNSNLNQNSTSNNMSSSNNSSRLGSASDLNVVEKNYLNEKNSASPDQILKEENRISKSETMCKNGIEMGPETKLKTEKKENEMEEKDESFIDLGFGADFDRAWFLSTPQNKSHPGGGGGSGCSSPEFDRESTSDYFSMNGNNSRLSSSPNSEKKSKFHCSIL